MNGKELRAWAVASAAVFCLGAIGFRVLTAPALPDLTPTINRANVALDTVNRPCKGSSCGTLANVDKLVVKVGDVAVDTQRQIQQSGTLINAASASLTSTSEHLNAAVDTSSAQLTRLGPLLDSARGAMDSLPPAVQHVTADADALTPVLLNANGAVGDFRTILQRPSLAATMDNAASMTGSWAGISGDARKVADKATVDYLKPVPWYLWPVKRSGELLDVGAAIARHTP